MAGAPDPAGIFAAVYLQALAIAILAAGSGRFLQRRLQGGVADPAEGSALRWGRGFFIGVSAFLLVFVVLSRIAGARAALWVGLGAMVVACAMELAAWRRDATASRAPWGALAALVALVAAYSFVDGALWIRDSGAGEATYLLGHMGSIHSGRYANYAVFIADHDRLPWIAQNAAQAILASLHLMLGTWSPVAALMAWIPVSMAFLTLLLFGIFRAGGFTPWACAATAFMVMFCNVALSGVHVLVFDNGSPFAFVGYADTVLAIGGFLVLAAWLRDELVGVPRGRGALAVPALFGAAWCWHAPQNLVIALAAGFLVAFAWHRKAREPGAARRIGIAGLAFAIGIGVGGSQLGTLLPAPLREDTGLWTQELGGLGFRPYVHYVRSHWSQPKWSIEPGVNHLDTRIYERTYARSVDSGPDEVYRGLAWLLESQAWDSLRIYGFPLLGLLLLSLVLRPGAPDPRMRAWLALSAASFATGYLICFLFELAHMKWWLTRFLMPGTALALACLGFAALIGWRGRQPGWLPGRRACLLLLVLAATLGPIIELGGAATRNFVLAADSIRQRLSVIARHRGYFILEGMGVNGAVARWDARWHFTVGESRQRGLALFTRPMPLAAGTYRAAFRVSAPRSIAPEAPLVELDVVAAPGTTPLARRAIAARDLVPLDTNDTWAVFDFSLAQPVKDASIRLSSATDAVFVVTDVRLEPR